MNIITIFLASSIVDFENERSQISARIFEINQSYIRRGLQKHIKLFKCENTGSYLVRDGRTQDSYNRKIMASDYFLLLVGNLADQESAGMYTIEELETAMRSNMYRGYPKIFIGIDKGKDSGRLWNMVKGTLNTVPELSYDVLMFSDVPDLLSHLPFI